MQTSFSSKCGTICLETVSQYNYLRVLLTEHLGITKLAKHVSKAANRALGLVLAKIRAFGSLPFKTFTKLFETMVWSAISYGAAIFGNRQRGTVSVLEDTHRIQPYTVETDSSKTVDTNSS